MTKEFKPPRMEPLKAAAEMFGLSYYAARNLVLSGKVPAIRLGTDGSRGKILVNCDALTAYLNCAKIADKSTLPAVTDGIRRLG